METHKEFDDLVEAVCHAENMGYTDFIIHRQDNGKYTVDGICKVVEK